MIKDTSLGRKLETILTQYLKHVKPAFEEFVLPVWYGLLWHGMVIVLVSIPAFLGICVLLMDVSDKEIRRLDFTARP